VIQSLLTSDIASRFYSRWRNAEPARAGMVTDLAELSMTPAIFAQLLQKETDAGMPLPRAMRRVRNLVVTTLIERDLCDRADLNEVMRTISDFADFAVGTHLSALMSEMTAAHGVPIGRDSGNPQEMIVIGMGKLGGGELNVSSDIDLIFVYPENGDTQTSSPEQRELSNHEFFTRLGRKLIGDLSEIAEDGFTFRVDMALRPNGASGPLVASFGMLEEYLIVQGREWERYAWVKARAMTGRPADIATLEQIVRPFVYRRYLDFGSIEALRNMHAQIRAEVTRQETRHPERSNNVKLGRGGIREVEFLAQVFQLIRGGRDATLRDRSTRNTLRTLAEKQLLTDEEVEQLLEAYTFLRNVEHRLQYLDDAQTHTFPANPDDCLKVAQMMGYQRTEDLLADLNKYRAVVASQFDAMFSDKRETSVDSDGDAMPVISANPATSDTDNDEALQTRLLSLGFDDAPAAARRLRLTLQSPRLQSMPEANRDKLIALMNSALPIIARVSEKRTDTLNRLLDFLEAIARRASYIALLTEYPHTLERVVRMMGASSWAAKYLTQHPILLDELLDDRTLRAAPNWITFGKEVERQLSTMEGDTEHQMNVLRDLHHAQLFRLLAQDLEGSLTVERLADHLSALADILVGATVMAAWKTIATRHRDVPKFAVIAYGKLGGKELGYASDLDVVFLYDDDDQEAPALYAKLAQRFITWMTTHTPSGILFDVDIALRPDGASGLLVSRVTAFEKYQKESAWVWEHQALTRARFCAGDTTIGERFEAVREEVLRQERDPEKLRSEVLAMRKRMHEAHPNRSDQFDLKHDAGGMIDIEFIVQFLVLRNAAQYPRLTADIGNIALLKLCGELGLIDATLAGDVAHAYRSFRKMQHEIRLQGHDRARVAMDRVARDAENVRRLWKEVMGDGS
jgi:glutamate-ammonia-ligase adenylyltransferase